MAVGSVVGVFRVLHLVFELSSHTSICSASALSDTRIMIIILVKPPLSISHRSASIRSSLKASA